MVLSSRSWRWLRWAAVLAFIALVSLFLTYLWGVALVDRAMKAQSRKLGCLRVLSRPVVLQGGDPWSRDELRQLFAALNLGVHICHEPSAFGVCESADGFWLGPGLGENPEPLSIVPSPKGIEIKDRSGNRFPKVSVGPSLLALVPQQDMVQWPIPLSQVSPELINATVDLEDRGFLSHSGLSLRGLLRAAWVNLTSQGVKQGGSTITQQVVKVLLLKPQRRVSRKMLEAFLASLLEHRFGKREILEAYLNNVYFGQDGGIAIVGVEAASRFYFGKPARFLALEEAALLAGLIAAPNRFDPVVHPEAARQRRSQALRALVEAKHVPAEQAQGATMKPLPQKTWPLRWVLASHFLDLIPAHKLSGDVPTTIDPLVQKAVWEGVQAGLRWLEQRHPQLAASNDPLQAAVVVVGPTGDVLGMLGSRHGRPGEFNRALAAQRPIGSLVKPFLVALALERGWNLQTFLLDEPLQVRVGSQLWSPQNHDGRFRGPVSLEDALVYSVNVPMVRLGLALGLREVEDLLQRLGLRPSGTPAELLGAGGATPLEVARAFTPFLHKGVLMEPWVWGNPGISRRIFSPENISQALKPLQEVVERGTAAGFAARFGRPLAGKTGTTDDRRDSWFVALRPKLLTVVWVGTDQNRETGLYGASGAGVLWQEIDRRLPAAYKGGAWN